MHYPFLIRLFSREDSKCNIKEIVDKKKQLEYGDIELHSQDNGLLYCELKTDRHFNSPNIFLEDISNSVKNTLGNILISKGDVLSYGFLFEHKLTKQYIYDLHDLKEWYLLNREKYKLFIIPNYNNSKEWIYNTLGRAIPRKIIENFLIGKIE